MERKFALLEQMVLRKRTLNLYSALYQLKLHDQLDKSQERLKREIQFLQQRFSTIEQQDDTTQQSLYNEDESMAAQNMNHFTSINISERSSRPPRHRTRYETPSQINEKSKPSGQKLRKFSPEEEQKNNFSRLEYSPIIVDDTEQSDDERLSAMIDPNFQFKGRDTLGGPPRGEGGLDTSRFASQNPHFDFMKIQENELVLTEVDKTQENKNTNRSYFIDPVEFVKQLKSPLVSPISKKRKTDKKKMSSIEKQNVIASIDSEKVQVQRSPVHFDCPNKYDHANNSRILDNFYLLGQKSNRRQSFRVVSNKRPVSPKATDLLLLKPQNKQILQQNMLKIATSNIIPAQSKTIKLLRFNHQK